MWTIPEHLNFEWGVLEFSLSYQPVHDNLYSVQVYTIKCIVIELATMKLPLVYVVLVMAF